MKKLFYLILPFFVYCCSPGTQQKEEAKSTQIKKVVTDSIDLDDSKGEINIGEIEVVEYDFDNGPVESRGSMKILLQNIGLANFSENEESLDDFRITTVQYGKDSLLLKPCEYDERGAFAFIIGSQVDHELAFDLYPLPIIEYDNQDPYYYYIEDIFVFDNGKSIELKLKEIHYHQGDYEIDEAESAKFVNISRSESKTILDFSEIVFQGHFMLESERENLPKAECDEDFH